MGTSPETTRRIAKAPENCYLETWTTFEELLADGKARAIGVTNVGSAHLDRLAARASTVQAATLTHKKRAVQSTMSHRGYQASGREEA